MADVTSLSHQKKHFLSDKVSHFTESVIREMTRQAALYGAVNLAQGFRILPLQRRSRTRRGRRLRAT
jgi:hypothetical protein